MRIGDPFDKPFSRRKALAGAGSVGLGALLAACGADDGSTTTSVATTDGSTTTVQPRDGGGGKELAGLFGEDSACTLTPEETEGPYYFDPDAIRSDVTEGRPGVPLRIAVRVRAAEPCSPIANAVVDIWQCDAGGVYSGFEAASAAAGSAAPGGGGEAGDERYLRGAQVTDADGIVQFRTIFPGWYPGRTAHIHAKVHVDNATVLTTQLYFDEALTAAVYEREPYSQRTGRETFNENDAIFDESLVVPLRAEGDGYLGAISFDVG